MKRRFIAHVLSAVVLTGGGMVAVPMSAQAATISQCTGQDGVVSRTVTLTSNKFTTTHANKVFLGKGVSYSRSKTITKIASITAGVTGETSVTGGADWKIAKLDATVTYTLAASASVTLQSDFTDTFSIAAINRDRTILFANGYTKATGTWKQLTCSRAPGVGTWYTGTVTSFNKVSWDAAFECNHALYPTSSEAYQASVTAGC